MCTDCDQQNIQSFQDQLVQIEESQKKLFWAQGYLYTAGRAIKFFKQ